jgi:radical SAM protein with 4Fe4S-binding SPASM domain
MWPVTKECASLMRAAAHLDTSSPTWSVIGSAFSSDWADNEADYSGRNLIRLDARDESAVERQVHGVSALQPWLIFLEVNQVCNLHCDFCYVDRLPKNVGDYPTLSTGIQRAAAAGALFLNITGGEPSLCRDLVRLTQEAISLGLAVTIRTNLYRLPLGIKELAGEPRVVFVTSFHHAEPGPFDEFVGRRGAWSRISENIGVLRDLGLKVRASIVATQHNAESLDGLIAYMGKLTIPYTLTDHIMPRTGERGDVAATTYSYKIGSSLTRNLLERGLIERHRNLCTAAQSKLWLDAKGRVYPCELFREEPIGNYLQNSLKDILHENSVVEWRKEAIYESEPAGCTSCGIRGKCPRCPAMIYMSKGRYSDKHELTCQVSMGVHGRQDSASAQLEPARPLLPLLPARDHE